MSLFSVCKSVTVLKPLQSIQTKVEGFDFILCLVTFDESLLEVTETKPPEDEQDFQRVEQSLAQTLKEQMFIHESLRSSRFEGKFSQSLKAPREPLLDIANSGIALTKMLDPKIKICKNCHRTITCDYQIPPNGLTATADSRVAWINKDLLVSVLFEQEEVFAFDESMVCYPRHPATINEYKHLVTENDQYVKTLGMSVPIDVPIHAKAEKQEEHPLKCE